MISLKGDLSQINNAMAAVTENKIVPRIWDLDYTVWKSEPTEITNRLGWLRLPETMRENIRAIEAMVADVKAAGYTHVLLLGMGGSSLAPEVFSRVFADESDGLTLSILDSTDAGAVLARDKAHDLSKTLFIVATKSGGTVETLSFFKYFYNRVVEELGEDNAGDHFIAVTDPGSKLEAMAAEYKFRKAFINDPNVGGRFSVLSLFGLVPAGLIGVDLNRLLDAGAAMAAACQEPSAVNNPGAALGVIIGVLAQEGRDKLTLVLSPEIANLGDWVEQLVAESTGKEGHGILPVVWENVADVEMYGDDRVFVAVTLGEDASLLQSLKPLGDAGHPVINLVMADRYDIGQQFFLWEFATAVASHILKINVFDQPNVEAAKRAARSAVGAFMETGALASVEASAPSADALDTFMAQAKPGDYVALQAYVTPDDTTTEALFALQKKLREVYKLAVTVGYGPRFLHSTGQLHKGDSGNGLFIQFISDAAQDVAIPDEAGKSESTLSFATLKQAQADGDRAALLEADRRFVRFDLGGGVAGGLAKLVG